MLGSIWPFLKDPASLAVHGSIGAVIAATSLHRSAQRERDRFNATFNAPVNINPDKTLAELRLIDRAEVLHLIGPPATGKSHLSLALAVEAVKAGRSVYFGALADIISALAKADARRSIGPGSR
jgi:DNA replication protein DnaC